MFSFHKRILYGIACFLAVVLLQSANVFASVNNDMSFKSSLPGQSDIITSLSYSPDGKILASAGKDDMIKLYYLNDNKTITISGHDKNINQIIFSPDSKLIASCSEDNTIKLWDCESGKLYCTLSGLKDSVNVIAFSGDGNTLYSGSSDGKIAFWNVQTGQKFKETNLNVPIKVMSYDKNNNVLAVAINNNISLIDAQTGYMTKYIPDVMYSKDIIIDKLLYSPDGKYIICTNSNLVQPVILSCNEDYGKISMDSSKFNFNASNIWSDCIISKDGHYLIGADKTNDKICVFNFYSGNILKYVSMHPTSIAVSPDNREIAAGNLLNNVNIYDTSDLPDNNLESIKIDLEDSNSFIKGQSVKLALTGHYSDDTDRIIDNSDIIWQASGDATIMNGYITPADYGTMTITASYKGLNYTMIISISKN